MRSGLSRGREQVLDYVGRYTHRVAISNSRLVSMDDGKVRFRWKDYRNGNRQKTMTLEAAEFIRRFLIHVLPDGFHRIRYYGFLGNCHRARKLTLCRELLGMAPAEPVADDPPADYRDRFEALTGQSLRHCPHCHTGIMLVIESLTRPKVCLVILTHHDPRSTSRPHDVEPPARSERGRCGSGGNWSIRTGAKRPASGCTNPVATRLVRSTVPNRRSRSLNGAQSMAPGTFNAHSPGGRARGLVQSVFTSPARPRPSVPFARSRAPRR